MSFVKAKKNALKKLKVLDYLSALIAWILFWLYRQNKLFEANPEWEPGIRMWSPRDYVIGLLIIPFFWIFLHYLSGAYFSPYRKSRLQEINRTLMISFIGSLIIGFTAIANDWSSFNYFFKITALYFCCQFLLTSLFRFFLLTRLKKHLLRKDYSYNAIIIGGNGKAEGAYNEIKNSRLFNLYNLKGYVNVANNIPTAQANIDIPLIGTTAELEEIIDKHSIEEVVIALESSEHNILEDILIQISYKDVYIKIIPDLFDILTGTVKTANVYDPIFINVNPELLPDWQKVIKRMVDILASSIGILLLSPLYIIAMILVKRSSPGPIFYKQERIGLLGKPFYIFKFRSMYLDAEKHGPALSKTSDPRITPWGRIMRKWRIDEIPQFFNILNGDMSLVGPRPERQYFIQEIIKTHPQYKYLHRVKPGLTSWGMVQYGYAENVNQMIERMKFDLLYIKSCSLMLDIKIIIYTLKVIAQGRGK